MKRVGILTCKAFPNLTDSDRKLIPILEEHGYLVQSIIWNEPNIDWTQFHSLIFRSTWDYFEFDEQFSAWLDQIAKMNIKTYNSIPTIIKNKHKFYLKNLEDLGINIIPSIFLRKNNSFDLISLIPKDWNQIIIKPAVSAGSYLTRKFQKDEVLIIEKEYAEIAIEKDLIIQKYMEEIETDGEVSLVFFNKRFSHAVVKKPKKGDFRIQSQFGGIYSPFIPSIQIKDSAINILENIPESLLFARVDGLIINEEFYLMELELIEPDLYLELTDNGQQKFVSTFLEAEKK